MRGQERVVFKQPEKSRLGLDALALAKRNESKLNGTFKAPRERINSVAASFDEEEKPTVTDVDEDGVVAHEGGKRRPNRRYLETALSETPETESTVVQDDEDYNRFDTRHNNRSVRSEVYSRHDKDGYEDYSRSERNRGTPRRAHECYDRRSSGGRYERDSSSRRNDRDYSGEYDRKRSRYEEPRRTPGRSDWDDGRWEWEETPRRDGHQTPSRRYQPSPSPILVGVSPDARLVSPWRTPRSGVYSSWEQPAPSPVPIRASGSVRSSNSQYKKDVLPVIPIDQRTWMLMKVPCLQNTILKLLKICVWKWNTIQIMHGMIEKREALCMTLTAHLCILATIRHTRRKKWNWQND